MSCGSHAAISSNVVHRCADLSQRTDVVVLAQ